MERKILVGYLSEFTVRTTPADATIPQRFKRSVAISADLKFNETRGFELRRITHPPSGGSAPPVGQLHLNPLPALQPISTKHGTPHSVPNSQKTWSSESRD